MASRTKRIQPARRPTADVVQSPWGRWAVPLLFAAAFLIRLFYVLGISDSPLTATLIGDGREYDAWAQRIADGEWHGSDVFYQAPLYPYLLGVVYSTIGRDLLMVRILQQVRQCVL